MTTETLRTKGPPWRGVRAAGPARGVFAMGLGLGAWATTAIGQPGIALSAGQVSAPLLPSLLTPVAVFGADDRIALTAQHLKLQEAIGVLFNIRSQSVCTAFCVSDNVVATAAHCLFRTSGERLPRLGDFWFARNYDQTRDYARIAGYNTGAAAQNVIAGSTRLSIAPPIDATSDWALIRLSRPVCTKGVLAVEPMPVDDIIKEAQGQRVFQIAYHRDYKQWRQAYSKPCSAAKSYDGADWATIASDFTRPEHLILHTCDTGSASSGSPLLIETKQGPRVVGINVGTYVQSKVVMRDGQVAQRLKSETVANTGVALARFAPTLEAFKSAAILSTAAQIKDLQERLKQRGYYDGPLDGTYGRALKAAIEAYEAADQRPVTGIASDALVKRLKETSAAR